MNKTVLVTGSSQGIGAAIIRELAKEGYNCIINYNNSKDKAYELNEEIKSYNVKSLVIKCDVSNEQEVDLMFNQIEKEFGGVDILINNAAVDIPDLFYKKKVDNFKKTLDVNLIGSFITAKRAKRYMINKKWGRIINISSTNGINTYYPMGLEYDASKAALNSLTHNLAIEFAPYVTVNAIAPGLIATENEIKDYDDEFMAIEVDKILVKRIGQPNEVAKLIKFLISDDASYINNSIIRIDGGQYSTV